MVRRIILLMLWMTALGGHAFAGLAVLGPEAEAKARLALVVGVGDYKNLAPLSNTVNDARLIARTLEARGFGVTLVLDPDGQGFIDAVDGYIRRIEAEGPTESVFYYAGQGVEIDGRALMTPTDVLGTSQQAFEKSAISFHDSATRIRQANPRGVNIFLFDACRDDPFRTASAPSTRSAATLSASRTVSGSLLVYAVGPGGLAEDGRGENGPFATAVAAALELPGLNQSEWFRAIRNRTVDETQGRQVPTMEDNLSGDYVFNTSAPEPVAEEEAGSRAARAVYEEAPGVLRPTYEDGSFALLVGVSDYDMSADGRQAWRDLPAIPEELDRLGSVLRDVHGFDVETVMDPTSDGLRQALEGFVNRHGAKPNARLLVMMAGHGATTESFGKKTAWFVPRDAPAMTPPAPFRNAALNLRRIEEWSEVLEAKHVLWIFDSCFSGAAIRMIESRSGGDGNDGWSTHLHTNPVRRVITAGSENEEVPARSRFTERLTDILAGKVEIGEGGMITGAQIGNFLREDVIRYTFKQGLPKVTPQSDTIVIPGEEGDIIFRVEQELVTAWQQDRK